MYRKKNSLEFDIPYQKIVRNKTEQLAADNPMARAVAQPLFDAGIETMGLARKSEYVSGSPRCRQYDLFMLVLQGELKVHFGRRKLAQKPGMLSFCPKTVPFARENKTDTTWWIYFQLKNDGTWDKLRNHGAYVCKYESTDQMLLLVSRILDARRSPTILSRLDALEDSRCLATILKRELRIVVDSRPQAHQSESLQRLVKRIHKNPEKKCSVSEMASEAGMSPRTLSRAFRREYGMGPVDFVIQSRIDAATEMLATTDDTIEAIARALNYKSAYSFSTLFKRHLGIRPGQFRKQCRAEKER